MQTDICFMNIITVCNALLWDDIIINAKICQDS